MNKIKNISTAFKSYFNPTDIFEALRPILLSSVYVGVLPLKLIGKKPNRSYAVSPFGFFNATWHICLFGFCFYKTVWSGSLFQYFFEDSSIAAIAEIFQLILALFAMIVVYTVPFAKRMKFIALINMLNQIDGSLISIGINQNYKKMLQVILTYMTSALIVFIVYICGCNILMRTPNHEANFYAWITYFLPHIVLGQITLKFTILIKSICYRFICVNQVLKR